MNNRTHEAIERQIEAMGAEVFEVGLFKPGATPEMLPRVWDRPTLLRSVGWLKYQNGQGRNIYIRPRGEHWLSLIDDLNWDAVDRMKRGGFEPCVVVETSPGNFQAWVNHGRVLPKAESTTAARALAERFGGDKGAADWRHFGRLAGLTNRKPKYQGSDGQFPFVHLVEASPAVTYAKAESFLREVRSELHRRSAVVTVPVRGKGSGHLTIDDFRVNPKYGGDGNRIDLAYAVYSLSHDVSETEVRSAIRSRDLSKKGNEVRQEEYVNRTLRKAAATLSGVAMNSRWGRRER